MEEKDIEGHNQKNSNVYKIVVIILVILGLALLGIGSYQVFNKKPVDNQEELPNNDDQPSINTELSDDFSKIVLNSENMNVNINGSFLTMRIQDNSLYVNDILVHKSELDDDFFTGYSVYSNSRSLYALVEVNHQGKCGDSTGYICGAINDQGELVEIEQKTDENYRDFPVCSLSIVLKDGQIIGTRSGVDNDNNEFSYNIEYIVK